MDAALRSRSRISYLERHENVGVLSWQSEIRRHHTDHRVVVSTQPDGFAKRMRIAGEKVLPERIAHIHDTARTIHVLFGGDDTTEHGSHAERFEKPSVHIPDTNLYRFRPAGVVDLINVDSAALRERLVLPLDVDEVHQRIVLLHRDELLRIFVRKGREQD